MKKKTGLLATKLLCTLFCATLWVSCKTSPNPEQKASTTINTQPSFVLERIRESGTLRVGTTGDFKPFSYQTAADTLDFAGVDIELAKDLANSLEVRLQLIHTSWPTLMEDLKSNTYDIGMSGITITPSRQEQAFFSIPVYTSGKAAITRDEDVSLYNSIDAINQKRVRVIFNPGGTNEAFARENFPEATLIQNEDNLSIFQKIVDGEADVMVTDAIETLVQERIHPELEAVNPTKPFNSFSFGYVLPKDSIFKKYVDEWLLSKQKEGMLQKVLTVTLDSIE